MIMRLHQYAASILPPGKADGKPVLAKKLLPCLEEMMEKVIFPPYICKAPSKLAEPLHSLGNSARPTPP